MGFVFYLISALAVGGALAAVLLKNLVHCALAVTVAFARAGAAVSCSSMRSLRGLRRFWSMLAQWRFWSCSRFC